MPIKLTHFVQFSLVSVFNIEDQKDFEPLLKTDTESAQVENIKFDEMETGQTKFKVSCRC